VPNPRDIEAYQLANADVVAAAGAATVIDEAALEMPLDDAIVDHLAPLLTDSAQREAMAHSMRSLARPDAANEVTESIRSILGAASAAPSLRRAA
jgi:UDP-N-acetylglucosamine:LPS N-acetylglucosamine transferase